MVLRSSTPLLRLVALSFAVYGCSSLIGLGSLERVDCVDDCGGSSGGDAALAGAGAGDGGRTTDFGGAPGAGAGGAASAHAGAQALAGTAGTPSDPPGDAGAAGAAGAPNSSACPGGPAPVAQWTEHWFEHDQVLTRVSYADCAAVYFDAEVPSATSGWLSPFVSKAWAYTVSTYGTLGPERVYAVFHQDKYFGGHSATFMEASHDFHNTIDAGSSDWSQNYADITLTLLGFITESTAAHTKFGSPAGALWGSGNKWEELYKYDVYLGLGLNDQATAAFNKYSALSVSYPRANTFWFRDWFYPLWRDHGHAQVMVNFYGLLEKYYPATNQQMGAMNWGEYVHFSSGAAHTNLKPLATAAFGWPAEWDSQFLQAQTDYPEITY